MSGIPEGPFRPHEAAIEEGGRGRRGTGSQASTIGGRRDSGCRAGGQPTGTKGMISWFTVFVLWPNIWCGVSVFLFVSCLIHSQRSPIEVEEEREREEDWMKAPSPYGISQWGPQTPSVFPPPSPYSYSYAESFHEEACSLEMGPPRVVPTLVCFGYVVVVFCIELCLTVL